MAKHGRSLREEIATPFRKPSRQARRLIPRRILRLIHLFALQGLVLSANTLLVAVTLHQPHLYFSALLTVV